MEKIMVSVYCLAYNHEKYIESALKGFVNQNTDFDYEVFVHDDASQDGTAQIIKKYADKYPQIIKPIYQTENQYSKGVRISREIIYPKMRGKYIAICEGDDYWCNEFKLQKQVDFLEKHKEYAACVHNTRKINCQTGKEEYINESTIDMDLEFKKVVKKGNAEFQLSSVMCRREMFDLPQELEGNGFGDYPLAIYLMLNGKIRYLKDVMSVYRLYTEGSWTYRQDINSDLKTKIDGQKKLVDFLQRLNKYSRNKKLNLNYQKEIQKVLREQEVTLLNMENKGKIIYKEYKDIYDTFSFIEKMKVRFPVIRNIIRNIKNRGK